MEQALGPGAQPDAAGGRIEQLEVEALTVATEPGAVLVVDATPQVGRATPELVADAVVAPEATGLVAPGQIDTLLPVRVVAGRVQSLVGHPGHFSETLSVPSAAGMSGLHTKRTLAMVSAQAAKLAETGR